MLIARMSALLCAGLLLLGAQGDAAASAHAAPGTAVPRLSGRYEQLTYRGRIVLSTVRPRSVGPAAALRPPLRRPAAPAVQAHPPLASSAQAVSIPIVPSRPVVGADPNFTGFLGLTSLDQFNAGSGSYRDTQSDSEPPDPALCAGNGFVVEAVNAALAVYRTGGQRLIAPVPLNAVFRVAPQIAPGRLFGPALSTPKCLFDRDTQRWFLSVGEIELEPHSGTYSGRSAILIAVSTTSDPTAGYRLYAIDTTDAQKSGCPCYGRQPLLGADANGIYLSVNEYVTFPVIGKSEFFGSQIYALAKTSLADGILPTVVHVDAGSLPIPGLGFTTWNTLQPATAPGTSIAGAVQNGTEFFLSALDFAGLNDNRIAVWALTETRSLLDARPIVSLQHVVISSDAYGRPPAAVQRAGLAPLGASIHAPLETLDAGDDRMSQAVLAGGRLWSSLTTAVRSTGGVTAGVAFFAVVPSFDPFGSLTAAIDQQGYIAVAGQNITYPAIGADPGGGAILTATLSGPQYFPSAVYVSQDGRVHLAAAGAGPDDGYTGYAPFGGYGIASWGGSSAAVADSDGNVWMTAEFIPGERSILSNWGTFIGHLRLAR